jgi:hypothetical protein
MAYRRYITDFFIPEITGKLFAEFVSRSQDCFEMHVKCEQDVARHEENL